MFRNILDTTISAEDLVQVDAAIGTLEAKLPMLVGLAASERLSLSGLGPQSKSFADDAFAAAKQYSGLMPRDLDMVALERDKVLRETLVPRFERLRNLTTKMDHTILLAGSEYYHGGLMIYRALQAFGRAAGLDELIRGLARRFRKAKNEEETPGTPTTPTNPNTPSI